MSMDRIITVSVVCLTYNHAQYIRDALDGFVMQKTDFPFEVLVHDDASTDGTAEIVREYERKYPEIIRGIYQEENQHSKGVNITKTFLYPLVRGEFVAFCEGDDYWTDPLKLQKQVDALRARPGIDICAHRVKSIQNVDGRQKIRYVAPSLRSRVLSADEVIKGGGWYVSTPSLLCRSEVFLKDTPMRQVLTMDYVLQIQASLRGGMYYMEDCMAVYRKLAPGSWSEAHPHGLDAETRNRMLDALDSYTEGRFHKAIEHKKRHHRHPNDIGMLLWRLGREMHRFIVKLRYPV